MTTTPVQIARAKKWIARLENVALEGRGHWLMVEAKEAVTEKVLRFLEDLKLSPRAKL